MDLELTAQLERAKAMQVKSSGNPEKVINIEKLQLESDLVYPEYPIKIVDFKTRVTRNQTSNFYKVQWSNHSEREATWETEEFIQFKCPELLQLYQGIHFPSFFQFNTSIKSRDEISFRGKDCNTLPHGQSAWGGGRSVTALFQLLHDRGSSVATTCRPSSSPLAIPVRRIEGVQLPSTHPRPLFLSLSRFTLPLPPDTMSGA